MKTSKRSTERLTGADRRWGFKAGCDGWITNEQACDLTGYTRQHLWFLAKQGKIRKAGTAGRSIRYCKRSVMSYIEPVEV